MDIQRRQYHGQSPTSRVCYKSRKVSNKCLLDLSVFRILFTSPVHRLSPEVLYLSTAFDTIILKTSMYLRNSALRLAVTLLVMRWLLILSITAAIAVHISSASCFTYSVQNGSRGSHERKMPTGVSAGWIIILWSTGSALIALVIDSGFLHSASRRIWTSANTEQLCKYSIRFATCRPSMLMPSA